MNLNELKRYAEANLNVIISGRHGVGKSVMMLKVLHDLKLQVKYYSAATLDPWADLVGIPVPVDTVVDEQKVKELQFIRPRDIEEAEVVVFDELNRAHPKVLNAVLEMIQFKSINGEKLPKLKMVWAAINPSGGAYQVNDLDPALLDRFEIHLEASADPSKDYLGQACGNKIVAGQVVDWWYGLQQPQREVITPRRLEYMCKAAVNKISIRSFVPLGVKVPITSLEKMLQSCDTAITYDNMRDTKFRASVIARLKQRDIDAETSCIRMLNDLRFPQVINSVDILEALPAESRARVFSSKVTGERMRSYIGNYYTVDQRKAETEPAVLRLLKLWDEYENTRRTA